MIENQGENEDLEGNATKKTVTNKDIFTREERRRFFRAIDSIERLLFCRLGFYGGLRVSEILNLKFEDLIDSDSDAVLHIREPKGGQERFSCIDDGTVALIRAYQRENKLPDNARVLYKVESTRTLQRWFKEILEASGITRIEASTHTARHTNITMLLESGMDLAKVKDHAGHKDISTTQIYLHLTYKNRAREYNNIVGE